MAPGDFADFRETEKLGCAMLHGARRPEEGGASGALRAPPTGPFPDTPRASPPVWPPVWDWMGVTFMEPELEASAENGRGPAPVGVPVC